MDVVAQIYQHIARIFCAAEDDYGVLRAVRHVDRGAGVGGAALCGYGVCKG